MFSDGKILISGESLRKAILKEKARGTPDILIGEKFGVSYKFIERVITQEKGINVSNLLMRKKIKHLEAKNFKLEKTSVWSFKQRGDWATHSGEYRGNYSPYIPRNVILRYSNPGDLVLDMFCGGGTTAIEAKLLGRRCIASDINEEAIELAKKNLDFDINLLPFPGDQKKEYFEPQLMVNDARNLSWVEDESVDLICSHPPYANIIHYTDNKSEDLSFLDIDEFLVEMKKVARECFRVLKPGRKCAMLIGDTRRKKHVIPLGFRLINVFLDAGFSLRELVIKRQHNCKTTGFWYNKSIENNFLLLAHEYLPIFEKAQSSLRSSKIKEQTSLMMIQKKKVFPEMKQLTLETSTVWIFPEKDKNELQALNLIKRYASENNFLIFEVSTRAGKYSGNILRKTRDSCQMFWIKSNLADDNYSDWHPEEYLSLVREAVNLAKSSLNSGGFLAIDARDVRAMGYLMPVGKMVMDMVKDNELWLKEVIIVTTDRSKMDPDVKDGRDSNNLLDIIHKYVLIYKRK